MRADRWHLLADVARRQYGVASLAQLFECGFERRAISRAVAAGHLYQLHRGVFAVGHSPTDPRSHWLAATLACGEASFLSHRPGAELLGMLPAGSGPPEVTVPTQNGRRLHSVRIHRTSGIEPDEHGSFENVPCASPARVVLDVAAIGAKWELERCIREGMGLGLLEMPVLEELLDRHRGRRGTARVRSLITGSERPVPGLTRSELERRIHRLCRREGIDPPLMNVRVEPTFAHSRSTAPGLPRGSRSNATAAGTTTRSPPGATYSRTRH